MSNRTGVSYVFFFFSFLYIFIPSEMCVQWLVHTFRMFYIIFIYCHST